MKAYLFLLAATVASAALLRAPTVQRDWKLVGAAPKDRKVQVIIALKKDLTALSRRLDAISDPASPSFREWLSREEEQALTVVADASPVLKHFRGHGIAVRHELDTITASMTVEEAERVFATTISMHKSARYGHEWHRADALHAPAEFAAVTAGVYGLHDFPLPPPSSTTVGGRNISGLGRGLRQSDNSFPIGPTDIRKRYQVPVNARGDKDTIIRQAVAEFQGQFMDTADLQQFFQQYVPFAKSGDEKVYAFRGDQASGFGVEALLDIQYIMGVAPGVLTEFWALRSFDFCSDLKVWLQSVLKDSNPPVVFSVSYGLQDDVPSFCSNYQDIDNDFMRVASRGITIVFASGDSGSGWDGQQLWPSWPAISPYVISVGATCFTNKNFTTERTTLQFGTGSGFSGLDPVPSWQTAAVNGYVTAMRGQLPPDNVWKTYKGTYGRGTADVSALGEGYNVVVQGSTYGVGGTSASAPTFAALISLINTQLHSQNKRVLGYLNRWVYDNPRAFIDVTIGDNKIDRNGDPVPYGFATAPGWDPPTGFGTPNFPALLQAALK